MTNHPNFLNKDYIIPLFFNIFLAYALFSNTSYSTNNINVCPNSTECPLKLALKKCNETDNWSIHGLWLDYRNGSYPEYCSKMNFNSLDRELNNELNLKWYSCEGENNNFWNHELQKHASCIRDYILPNMDSTEYFKETLNLYNGFDKVTTYICNKKDNNCLIELKS